MLNFTFDTGLGVAGLITGAIGICLAIYFYLRSVQKPAPNYGIHPLRVRIVDQSRSDEPGVAVTYDGETMAGRNVTAATVYFWNDGRAPLRKGDVLTPYTIELDPSTDVLDGKVVRVTREVCGFQIHLNGDRNRVELDFT